ncbi:hypothetical protein D3C75_1297620 [compost metagenome]
MDVFAGHEVRQAGNALPLQRQVAHGLAAGRADGGLDRPTITVYVAQWPLVEALVLGKPQQCMACQFGDA